MLLVLLMFAEIVVVGGLLLIQPLVARRGLLFGVYVGEARWDAEEARAITRRWNLAMLSGMGVSLLLGALTIAWRLGPPPAGFLVSMIVLLVASYAAYLAAYFRARRLALPGAPAAAAAFVVDPPYNLLLPLASLVVAIAGGVVAGSYAWLHYAQMPAIVPTHFGPSGRPDAWSPRSFWTVMLLPLATFLLPPSLAVIACLTARAKRAIRRADRGVSVAAQMRFRRATASFLSGAVVLITLMLTSISIFATRTAVGLSQGIPAAAMALAVLLVVYAIVGSLYIAIRLGQGGSRLERTAGGAPLTNGVADNERWYLGGFYVNRDDPSILVEKRFGVGYTINFGNPKAVCLLVAFLLVVLAIVVAGLLTPQTHVPPVR